MRRTMRPTAAAKGPSPAAIRRLSTAGTKRVQAAYEPRRLDPSPVEPTPKAGTVGGAGRQRLGQVEQGAAVGPVQRGEKRRQSGHAVVRTLPQPPFGREIAFGAQVQPSLFARSAQAHDGFSAGRVGRFYLTRPRATSTAGDRFAAGAWVSSATLWAWPTATRYSGRRRRTDSTPHSCATAPANPGRQAKDRETQALQQAEAAVKRTRQAGRATRALFDDRDRIRAEIEEAQTAAGFGRMGR